MSRSTPQYVPITMPSPVTALLPHYRLLAYTEGANKNIEQLKSVKFTGVPVLFIPDMSVAASYKVQITFIEFHVFHFYSLEYFSKPDLWLLRP